MRVILFPERLSDDLEVSDEYGILKYLSELWSLSPWSLSYKTIEPGYSEVNLQIHT